MFQPLNQKPVNSNPPHWNSVKLNPVHKQSQFWSKNQDKFIFDPHTETKTVSIHLLTLSEFRSRSLNHVNFRNSDSYTEIKPSSIPDNEIKSISTTHTETKSSSILTLKPSYFRSAYKNQVNIVTLKQVTCDLYTKTDSMLIHRAEMKSFSTTHTSTVSFSFYPGIKSSSIPRTEIMLIWTVHTRTKSIFKQTLKSSEFRPACKYQVHFFDPHNNRINFIPTLRSNQIRSPSQIKSISVLGLTTSNFRPAHKNKVNFEPRTKNKSISVLTLKPSQFIPPTHNQVKFHANFEIKST